MDCQKLYPDPEILVTSIYEAVGILDNVSFNNVQKGLQNQLLMFLLASSTRGTSSAVLYVTTQGQVLMAAPHIATHQGITDHLGQTDVCVQGPYYNVNGQWFMGLPPAFDKRLTNSQIKSMPDSLSLWVLVCVTTASNTIALIQVDQGADINAATPPPGLTPTGHLITSARALKQVIRKTRLIDESDSGHWAVQEYDIRNNPDMAAVLTLIQLKH